MVSAVSFYSREHPYLIIEMLLSLIAIEAVARFGRFNGGGWMCYRELVIDKTRVEDAIARDFCSFVTITGLAGSIKAYCHTVMVIIPNRAGIFRGVGSCWVISFGGLHGLSFICLLSA